MSLPKRFADREGAAALPAEAEELEPAAEGTTTHRLAGRVLARRDMGQLVFLDLVDRSGKIQLLGQRATGGEDFDVALGDVVGVTGRPTRTKRGEPSLAVETFELLA